MVKDQKKNVIKSQRCKRLAKESLSFPHPALTGRPWQSPVIRADQIPWMQPHRAIPQSNARFPLAHGLEMGLCSHNDDRRMHARNICLNRENNIVVMHHRGHSRIFAIDDNSHVPSEGCLIQNFHSRYDSMKQTETRFHNERQGLPPLEKRLTRQPFGFSQPCSASACSR